MTQQGLNRVFAQAKTVENIAAATTLDQYDSGKIFTLDQDAAFAITLPTATTQAEADALKGWYARFILTDAGTNDVTIVRGDTSNDTLVGLVTPGTPDAAATGITVSSNVVTFADGVSVVGDYVDVTCTSATTSATAWHVSGMAST